MEVGGRGGWVRGRAMAAPEEAGFFGGAVACPEPRAFPARAESVGHGVGYGAVTVATAQRAGASSPKPRAVSTRNIAAAAQPGD